MTSIVKLLKDDRPSQLTEDIIAILLKMAKCDPDNLSEISIDKLVTTLYLDNWDNLDCISDDESQVVILLGYQLTGQH